MNDDIRYKTDPIISVNSLWKVFGKNPETALKEPYRNETRAEIQAKTGLVTALHDISF